MNWYLAVLKKYAVFDGRARRTEFWMFVLVSLVVSVVLGVLDGILGMRGANGVGLLGGLYSLAVLLPNIGVGIRRLHDTDRSGWWWLIAFVPLAGVIILIVFWAQEGKPGQNQYGPNPKGA